MSARRIICMLAGGVPAVFIACGGGGDGYGGSSPAPTVLASAQQQFRAIAGVSMGADGAMNLGTKHSDLFGTIAALGGPVDMNEMLRAIIMEISTCNR